MQSPQLKSSIPRTRTLASTLLNASLLACSLFTATAQAQSQSISMWSHWPDEQSKRTFIEERVKAFEAATPQCKVNLQFIQKSDLYASVKTSVRTGQAPDIFWLEPDEITLPRAAFSNRWTHTST